LNKKIIGILLIAILAIVLTASLSYYIYSQPTLSPRVPTEPASITKPSVPEFTVELVDSSYDVPTTYFTDPYTGENVTHEGYHVNRRTIEVKITNQPFEPYTDSDGRNINFYYNIRLKGHYKENWTEVYNAGEMPTQSNSAYTIIEYNSEGEYAFILGTTSSSLEFSPNGQVDFQVKALVGFASEGDVLAGFPSLFTGKESDWSETQTLTIP
jgi:hypothetical protein